MAQFEARLDALRMRVQDENFLHNRGLGNEVGFYVFDYPASRELEVRDFVARLKQDADVARTCNIVERNLWEVLLGVCRDKNILDKVNDLEARRGSDMLLSRLQTIATPERLVAAMDDWTHVPGRDVLIVTGVGEVFPFVRAHSILENSQHVFADIPMVMLYPGTYDKSSLTLFGKLSDSNYYRAFDLI